MVFEVVRNAKDDVPPVTAMQVETEPEIFLRLLANHEVVRVEDTGVGSVIVKLGDIGYAFVCICSSVPVARFVCRWPVQCMMWLR